MTDQRIQQEAICYHWFKQRLILSVPKPSISQRSQIKEDIVQPSMPAGEFNLKAYAAITWHNNLTSLGLEPRLADHRSQAARTVTLSTAPPRQARESNGSLYSNTVIGVLAVDMGCYIWYSKEGPEWAAALPCSSCMLYQFTNCNSPPINGQCTKFISFDVAL